MEKEYYRPTCCNFWSQIFNENFFIEQNICYYYDLLMRFMKICNWFMKFTMFPQTNWRILLFFFFLQEIKEFCYFFHSLQIKFMIFPAGNKWNVCYFLWHIDKIRLFIISRHYVLEKQHNLCHRSLMKIVLEKNICDP